MHLAINSLPIASYLFCLRSRLSLPLDVASIYQHLLHFHYKPSRKHSCIPMLGLGFNDVIKLAYWRIGAHQASLSNPSSRYTGLTAQSKSPC